MKSISINPSFFKISGKKQKKKKEKKSLFKNQLKPNDVKKKLIAKIKAHQKREKDKEIEEQEKKEELTTFKNEFQETLSYLQQAKTKNLEKKNKKKLKKTMKKKNNQTIDTNHQNISIDTQPMTTLPNDPPYGCLKNGSKPTWRQYNKTLKKNKTDIKNEYSDKPLFNLNSNELENDDKFEDRKNKLEKLQQKFKSMNTPIKPKTHKIKTRRRRRKITLGKINNKVGVLVKSKKTRRLIKNEIGVLKRKSIQEVKDYLRKHNLTKIGSSAPEHILRAMYENSYLTGDVKNKNPEILLHNWSKEE